MSNEITSNLKKVRKHFDMSGYAFAKFLNIPQQTYARYESGEQKPSAKLIEMLLKRCYINPCWFFGMGGEMFLNKISHRQQEILQALKRFDSFSQRLNYLMEIYFSDDEVLSTETGINAGKIRKLCLGKVDPLASELSAITRYFNARFLGDVTVCEPPAASVFQESGIGRGFAPCGAGRYSGGASVFQERITMDLLFTGEAPEICRVGNDVDDALSPEELKILEFLKKAKKQNLI